MARAKLKHGVIGAPGGARDNAGRKPDWFKAKCREMIEKRKLIDFVADVAEGKDVTVMDGGVKVTGPAKVKERLDATELLAKHGFDSGTANAQVNLTFVQILVGRLQGIVQRVIPIKCPHCQKMLTARTDMAREMETMGSIDMDVIETTGGNP